MTTQPALERYLLDLDKALGQIALSDRAEIITEIKSHILEAQGKNPQKTVTQLLESLGSPEQVANRYLIERGLETAQPPKPRLWAPIVKWFAIGSLGICTLAALVMVFLIWKFSPIIEIDGERETVKILGGLVKIDGKEGRVEVGTTTLRTDERNQKYEGKKELVNPKEYSVIVPFSNAKLELVNALGNEFGWSCSLSGARHDFFTENKKVLTLDLSSARASKCHLSLPKGIRVELKGSNGKIEIDQPRYNLDVSVANGKVKLLPDPNFSYLFDTAVTNGKMDYFESKAGPESLRVNIKLANGVIEKR